MNDSNSQDTPTLRDILAGHALTGLITAPSRPGVPAFSIPEMAVAAYRLADEMMKARQT